MPIQMKFKCTSNSIHKQFINKFVSEDREVISPSETEKEDVFSEIETMDPATKQRNKQILITKVPKMVKKTITHQGYTQVETQVLRLEFIPVRELDPSKGEDFEYSSKYLGGALHFETTEIEKSQDYEVGKVYFINVTP
jgi:hypothetical protein